MTKEGRTKYGTLQFKPTLEAVFYRTESGREPVRDWLRRLEPADKQRLGRDLRRLQMQWPIGMPLVRKIEPSLWEMRSKVSSGTARLLFTVDRGVLVALHGFIKKSAKLPLSELETARTRLINLSSGWRT
jgi:phage-related protein